MRKLYFLLSVALCALTASSQTLLIDPAGNGGFETGTTFVANGWTVANTTNANKWFLGTVPGGTGFTSRAAYISNDAGGATWTYSLSSVSVSHFYTDVTIPAGETDVTLSFNWQALGETGSYDALMVSVAPTSYTPTGSTTSLSTSPLAAPATTLVQLWNNNTYQTATIKIPASVIGNCTSASTIRLIFTWKNDSGGGTIPPAAIDNISLTSATPVSGRVTSAGGSFTIDNSLPNTGTNFTTFTEAINALNSVGCGFSSPVTFNVAAGQVFSEDVPAISVSGTSVNGISFIKSGTGANPQIQPAGTTGSTDFGFGISGGDYITINGIDIAATGSAVEYGYLVKNAYTTDGANFNTILNSSITLNRTNTSSIGILQTSASTGGGLVTTAASGVNTNNKYYNITIQNVYNGILLTGGSTTVLDASNEVGTIAGGTTTIGATYSGLPTGDLAGTYGIQVSNQSNFKIFNTTVQNLAISGSVTRGIYVNNAQGTVNEVYGNKVHGIRNISTTSTSSVNGMDISLASTGTHSIRVYNNFISNITSAYTGTASSTRQLKGIITGSGTATSSYHFDFNSVSIDGSGSPTISSVAFEFGGSAAIYNVRNNIFANFTGAQTGVAKHFAIRSTSATALGAASSVVNYNDYYIANTTNGFVGLTNTTDRATVTDWRNALTANPGIDANSISADPGFVNIQIDLHASASAINNAGSMTGIAWITDDIDKEARNMGNPDMGADEFTPNPIDLGVTTLVSPTSLFICENASIPVTVSIKNFGIAALDFATNNATITINITGPNPQTLTKILNSGTLAVGTSMDVFVGNYDMSAAGTYTFNAYTSIAGDGNSVNDTMTTVSLTVTAPVTTPQSVNFTGFTGANLHVVFPGWYEASGATVPTGIASSWTSQSNLGVSGNVTAKINLVGATKNEWIVSPKITATANTVVSFKMALTDLGSMNADPTAMQGTDDKVMVKVSTDCGATWTTLYTFDASNTSGISNTLAPFTFSLGAYAGQNLIVAFHALEGVDDAPSYDFHLDDITLADLPPCTGATAATISTTSSTVYCATGGANILATGYSTGFGTTYQWQSSTDNFASVITDIPGQLLPDSIKVTNLTSTLSYRLKVTCPSGTTEAFSNIITVTINPNPVISLTSSATGAICHGSTTVLTASSAADSYSWTPSASLSAATGSSVIAKPDVTTSYTVTGTVTSTGCSSSAGIMVQVQPEIMVNVAAATSEFCLGASTQLNATASQSVSPLKITEFTLYRTGTGQTPTYPTGMTGDDLLEISNLSSSSFDASGSIVEAWTSTSLNRTYTIPAGTVIPANETMVLHFGTGTDNATIRFFNTGGTSNSFLSSEAVGFVIRSGTNIIDVVAANSYAFPAASGITALDWSGNIPSTSSLAGAIRTAASDNNVASDWSVSSASLTQSIGTMNAGYIPVALPVFTYAWTPAASLDNASIENPVATPTTTTTYRLVVTETNSGCTDTSNITITVNQPPVIGTQPVASTVCAGSNATFEVAATGAGLSYQWRKDGVDIAGATSSTLTFTAAITDAGMYDVVITGTCGTITSTSVALNVNPLPVITSALTTTICSGVAQNYQITSDLIGTTYSWSRAAVSGISNTAVSAQTANPISEILENTTTTPVTVDYIIIPTANGCAGSAVTYSVTVNPTPAVTSAATGIVCSNTPQDYLITSAVAGTSFTWSRSAVAGISNAAVSGQTANPITEQLVNTTAAPIAVTYSIEPTANGCLGITFNYTVTVNPTPVVTSAANGIICSNAAQNYTITSAVAGTTFTWGRAAVMGISNAAVSGQTTSVITESLINTTNVPLEVIYIITPMADGCLGTSFNYAVTVNPEPAVTSAATGIICSNNAQNYTITSGVAGTTFTWSRAAVAGISNAAVSGQTANPITEVLVNTTGAAVTAVYTIIPSANGCSGASFTYSVTVSPTPQVTSAATATVCSNTSQNYTMTSSVAGTAFTWGRAAVAGISNAAVSGQTSPSITETLENTTNAPVIVTYIINTEANGCAGTGFNYVVTVNPKPATPTVNSNGPVCEGSNLQLTASSSTLPGATYSWSGPNGFASSLQNPVITGATMAATGAYSVNVTSSGCVSETATTTVTVNATPSITSATSATICSGTAQNYTITSGTTGASFGWMRAAVTGISNTAGTGTSATITETLINTTTAPVNVTYTIAATANGCVSNTFSYVVTVNPSTAIATHPLTQTICSGSPLNLTVAATGSSLAYQWKKNGTDIPGATNATLNIAATATTDAGIYTVVVTGACGSVTSNNATITVNNCPTAVPDLGVDVTSAVLMPNVVTATSTLRVQVLRNMKADWIITDMQGRIVMRLPSRLLAGTNDITFDLSSLASGSYQLSGVGEKGALVNLRFIKL